MSNPDHELMTRAKKGDRESFGKLYKKYQRNVFQYLWYRLGCNTEIAEDLSQETFTKALQHIESFEPREVSYRAYLVSIAHNVLVNYYRAHKPLPLDELQVDDTATDRIVDRIEQWFQKEVVKFASYELTPLELNILNMKYREGSRVKEIATKVGKTENAVKLILTRVRRKLLHGFYISDIAEFARQLK